MSASVAWARRAARCVVPRDRRGLGTRTWSSSPVSERPRDQHHRPPLSVSHVTGPAEPPLVEDTIYECFARRRDEFPDRPAVVSVHQGAAGRLSYTGLDDAAGRLATGLVRDLGLRQGDRVAMWSFNSWEWIAVQIATARVGLVLVNLSPAYTASELTHALRLTGCRAVITQVGPSSASGGAAEYGFLDILHEVVPEMRAPGAASADGIQAEAFPELRHVVGVHGGGRHNGAASALAEAGVVPFADVMPAAAHAGTLQRAACSVHSTDPINIQFTSGTTGLAKGTTLSHRNILNNGLQVGHRMGLTEADSVCVPVPMFHCFGLVLGSLAALSHGASVVFPAETFDAEATLAAVHAEQCTALHGVPTMFLAELNHPRFAEYDCSSLRTGIMAGTLCPVAVMRRVVDSMNISEMTVCYGMTECSPVTFQTRRSDGIDARTATIGACHPHVEAKIVPTPSEDDLDADDDGTTGPPPPLDDTPVPIGTAGELWTRGYNVMIGYWDQPDKTAEAVVDGGWMRTGDLAVMDETGYCRIVGRSKDVIIRGGENVFPKEVEECLRQHPAIDDVEVVGVPDAKYGEEICAVVKLVSGTCGAPLSARDVAEFCQGRVAKYKIPRYLSVIGDGGPSGDGHDDVASDFPMTLSGKVQKYRLRRMVHQALAGLRGGDQSVPSHAEDNGERLSRLVLHDRFRGN